MKKLYKAFLLTMVFSTAVKADSYIISVNGFSYSPSSIMVEVGDEVTIEASGMHPLRQVNEVAWNADEATQLVGGFGTETSDYTFTVITPDDIYFVCSAHVSSGMKGKVLVSDATNIADATGITELNVYPNPVRSGNLHVQSPRNLDSHFMEFYNAIGQLVKTYPLMGKQTEINARLPKGAYTAILKSDDKVIARKRLLFITE